ncbi:aromatic-ring-hydroxylating dioxygenase subunit beta [Novosphingobium sp. YJ-S2-02]|uniref:Aromatic-ring-hydroxylating dioxygenase subunit beta n=1 Tax=Novosphingobium aureum TaxID=2792964 RepID=A0A931MJV6_9SPHN|nr:aromatic-ring-hydroxylating dioxygenase subunit beta [Novosphingobium aureum]MBH0111895.1 aromatic-ring-hydroxylating dioxygenase subunit beta [Novosphingobium aureum]
MSTSEMTREDVAAITLDEATTFIWREAEILDRQDYKAWLPLFTPDGLYVIPIERDTGDRAGELNIAYDDAEMRAMRVKRLKSGFSISSAPSARTVRTTSRFVIEQGKDNSAIVRCAQMLVEYKFERTRVVGADVTYRLVRGPEGLRMARKEVLLLNSDDPLWGVGYLF